MDTDSVVEMTRKPQTQTKVCGRPVHLLRHLICLVLPFRFDPNQNPMNSMKFPLVHTKGEVSLVWIDPNCGLLCVWRVKKVESFRTNTSGCCRQGNGKLRHGRRREVRILQLNTVQQHYEVAGLSRYFFYWKDITTAGQQHEVENFDPFSPPLF